MKKRIRTYWRKSYGLCFTLIMCLEVLLPGIKVSAYELGKVKLEKTQGDYQHIDINKELKNQNTIETQQSAILKKQADATVKTNTYSEDMEVKEKRTMNSKTYRIQDGSYVTETFFEPIHKKEKNSFVDIDNTIEQQKGRSTTSFENVDGLYTFHVVNNDMMMENDKQEALIFQNKEVNISTYDINKDVMLYSEAYKNIDMEYRLSGDSVTTNFYINGPITQKEIRFTIRHTNLKMKEEAESLTFSNEEGKVVFRYVKPILHDRKGSMQVPEATFVEHDEQTDVVLSLNQNWINNEERSYPVIMQMKAADSSTTLNVTSAYNRSNEPTTTSGYYDLFVGYDDGSLSSVPGGFGKARTYIHLSNLNIGKNKVIVDAQMQLYKMVSYGDQWNTIDIRQTASYVDPTSINWNNKPTTTSIGKTNVRSDRGWQAFDFTEYITDLYKNKNSTIELRASDESSKYKANVFESESSLDNLLPRITIRYRDDFDVNPDIGIDQFDTEMRVYSKYNVGFLALSFDGIAKPKSTMNFKLRKKGTTTTIKTMNATKAVDSYFIKPIFITDPLPDVQQPKAEDVNYTTAYIDADWIPEFYTPYEFQVNVKSGSTTSKSIISDGFIKYKVRNGENLQTIATYYGLKMEEIKTDNNLHTDIIKEDDVLLLRFKVDNPKVSKDIYTPPVKGFSYKAAYVNRGPRCTSGSCEVIDPVNIATGNYFYEGTDFELQDFDEIPFKRYYNSTGPQLSNMFGNGFTTPFESYITYDKKGNLIYFNGDGKIYQIPRSGTSFKPREQDQLKVTSTKTTTTITDLRTGVEYLYNTYGYLASITSKEKFVTKLQYDEYGLLTKATMGSKTLTFVYNDNKQVKEIQLPSGRKVSYAYDSKRNLTTFTDMLGKTETYTYDTNGYMTSMTDKNGHKTAQNTYDTEGRVQSQKDGNGNLSTISYGIKETTLTKADGTKEQYTFNDEFDITNITRNGKTDTTYTYDDLRNITSETDEEGTTTTYTYSGTDMTKVVYADGTEEEYRYDKNHNVLYSRDREGNMETQTFQGNDLTSKTDLYGNTTTYEYDTSHRLVKETDADGVFLMYTYKGNQIASITHHNGYIESFENDAMGNVIREKDNMGKDISYVFNAADQIIQKNYADGTNEKWKYDGTGNPISYQNRLGGITTSTYDKNGNLIVTQNGSVQTKKSYNEINQLLSETDEQGQVKQYTYDVLGNKTSETDAYGHTTTYTYNAKGMVLETTDPFGLKEINEYHQDLLIRTTSKEGLITTYEYDDKNREIKRKNPNGTEESKVYDGSMVKQETDATGAITDYEFDKAGREIKKTTTYPNKDVSITKTTYDIYGNISSTTIDGAITKNTYDNLNRLVRSEDALGNTTKTEYDAEGNVVKQTDALGNSEKSTYDAMNHVLTQTDKNGNTIKKTYDTNGLLKSESDALNNVTTYTYNAKNQLVQITDPYKRKSTFEYDAHNQPTKTMLEGKILEEKRYDAYGRLRYEKNMEKETSYTYDSFNRKKSEKNERTGLSTTYTYDTFGNILQEEDSEGLLVKHEYDRYNREIKATDAYGRTTKNTYDERGQLVEVKNADGTTTKTTYDASGNVISTMDALGLETTKQYNALQQVIQEQTKDKVTAYVYDANGQVIETINKHNRTSTKTSYDKNGNVIFETDALGNVTKTIYDAKNQPISVIDALGNKTVSTYDAYGNVIKETNALQHSTQKKYNVYGLLEMEVDERGFETSYTYNDDLLLSEIKDAKGNITTYEYNAQHQVMKEIDPNGGVISSSYDVYGRVIDREDAIGKKTTTVYDVLGNVLEETAGNKKTVNTYDKRGNLLETSINDVVQIKNTYNKYNQCIQTSDAFGTISSYTFDIFGNVVKSNEKGTIVENTYDTDNNLIREVMNKTLISTYDYDANKKLLKSSINGNVKLESVYDAVGNEIKHIENGMETRTTYDAVNRVTSKASPNDRNEFVKTQELRYDESGNIIANINGSGKTEYKTYDAFGNVLTETNRKGIKSTYEYDATNNLTKAQNADDRYVSYEYDKANNKTFKMVNEKIAQYRYDKEGNLTKEEDEYGYTTSYAYDAFDRVTSTTLPNNKKIVYTYDNLGNVTSENNRTFTYDKQGNQTSATNEEGTVTSTYDIFNNLTKVKDTNGKTIQYTYDKENHMTSKRYGNHKISYTYTDADQIKGVYQDTKLVASYTYDNRGQVKVIKQGKLTTKKTYDNIGNVQSQKILKGNKTIYDAGYHYDENNNLIKEVINGKSNEYTYNKFDELESSQKYIDGKVIKTRYAYDLYGNRLEKSSDGNSKTYHYNKQNQIERIDTEKGSIRYTYDRNGNVSRKTSENGREDTYQYNDVDQLTKLQQGNIVYEYRYDAEKERTKEVKTDLTDYHYDRWYAYEEDLNVVRKEDFNDVFDKLEDQAAIKEANGNHCAITKHAKEDVTYYKDQEVSEYLVDRNQENSQVAMMNDDFYIYGEELLRENKKDIVTGWNESVVAEAKGEDITFHNYKDYGTSTKKKGPSYNGEWKDESGLINLRARSYDAEIGRFIQIDNHYRGEADNVGTQNRYDYALNNPYTYVDRTGKFSIAINDGHGGNRKPKLADYRRMNEKTFNKWIKKQPIMFRTMYTVERYAYQQELKRKKEEAKKTSQGNNKGFSKQQQQLINDAKKVLKPFGNLARDVAKVFKPKNNVCNLTDKKRVKNPSCNGGYMVGGQYFTKEEFESSGYSLKATQKKNVSRIKTAGDFLKGMNKGLQNIMETNQAFAKDPVKLGRALRKIDIGRFLSLTLSGIAAGVVLYLMGVGGALMFVGTAAIVEATGEFYDLSQFDFNYAKLIASKDCANMTEYAGMRYTQVTYTLTGSYAGYKLSSFIKSRSKGASGAKTIFSKGKDVLKRFNLDDAYVKPKHLSTSGGNGAKFLGGSKAEAEVILREGLNKGTIKTIADNGLTKLGFQSYEIIIDAGKVVGTKGETLIKIVLSEDGGMLSAYPVK